jgi:hypothetical protein
MTGDNGASRLKVSSLREGFFSRRSNLTTIASSLRFRIASYLAMTTALLEPVNGSVVEERSIAFLV